MPDIDTVAGVVAVLARGLIVWIGVSLTAGLVIGRAIRNCDRPVPDVAQPPAAAPEPVRTCLNHTHKEDR
jgi:hypothetical protein